MSAQPVSLVSARRAGRQHDRMQAATSSLSRLRAAEQAIEQAFSATADLAAELPRLRADARLSTVVGQPALDEVSVTLGHLSEALGGIVRTHGRLAEVGRIARVRPSLGGDPDKPTEDPDPKPEP